MTRKRTEKKTMITRHRSPSYGRAYLADGGKNTELRDSVDEETRDCFGPIRFLAHRSNIVTQRRHKTTAAIRLSRLHQTPCSHTITGRQMLIRPRSSLAIQSIHYASHPTSVATFGSQGHWFTECAEIYLRAKSFPLKEFGKMGNAVRLAATSTFYKYCCTIPGIPYQILYQRPVTLSRFCVRSETSDAHDSCHLPKSQARETMTCRPLCLHGRLRWRRPIRRMVEAGGACTLAST